MLFARYPTSSEDSTVPKGTVATGDRSTRQRTARSRMSPMTNATSSAIHWGWAVLSTSIAAGTSTVRKTRASATSEMAIPRTARPVPRGRRMATRRRARARRLAG